MCKKLRVMFVSVHYFQPKVFLRQRLQHKKGRKRAKWRLPPYFISYNLVRLIRRQSRKLNCIAVQHRNIIPKYIRHSTERQEDITAKVDGLNTL